MAKAAMMGTAKIALLFIKPPKISESIVVGSSVPTDNKDDDESTLVVRNSTGMGAAFNGATVAADVMADRATTDVVEGTKASADESSARQKRSANVILCDMVNRDRYIDGERLEWSGWTTGLQEKSGSEFMLLMGEK